MAILVNFKICDNAPECLAPPACPTGAIIWNEEKKTLEIDNNKCTSCGLCIPTCPMEAIVLAKTDEEYEKIKKEIDEDKRTRKDLFVDRYGATPLMEAFMATEEMLDDKLERDNLTFVEIYDSENLECLLKSIPLKEITENMPKDTRYYKADHTDSLMKKYDIKKLPALMIFKSGKMLGKIDGYYSVDEKEEFFTIINEIVNK